MSKPETSGAAAADRQDGQRGRPWWRRVVQAMVAGAVVASWMGAIEAALVCLYRNIPDDAQFIATAVWSYALLGAAVGLGLGAVVETIVRRGGFWRRGVFFVFATILAVAAMQLVVHTHIHWSGISISPGSAQSLRVMAMFGVPAAVLVIMLLVLCARSGRDVQRVRVLGARWTVALAVPLLAALAWPHVQVMLRGSGAENQPNVLLIVLDTTRADRLSAFGYDRPTTPRMEELAAEGTIFTRAYSAAPWTLPSHASIFTAAYPGVHNACYEHQVLDDRLPTLAEHMAGQGYTTAAFSRQLWLSDETGLMRGFEHFHDLYWRSSTALLAVYRLAADRLREGIEDKGARLVNEKVARWMDRYGEQPWFVFINYVEPHNDYEPPSPYREEFLRHEGETQWGRGVPVKVQQYNAGNIEYSDEDLAIMNDLYDGAVAYQDARMGELLDDLRARGLLDDTLVIITADHGENLGDHGMLGHEFCLYETLLHVPLLVRFPNVVPAAQRSDAVVENRLIWPLIDDLLWAASGDETVGLDDMAASLREEHLPAGFMLAELYRRPFNRSSDLWRDSDRVDRYDRRMRAVQLNGRKFIWGSDGRHEFFDLIADPEELMNLLSMREADVRALEELLQSQVDAFDDPLSGDRPELSEDLQRRLRSLGYLD